MVLVKLLTFAAAVVYELLDVVLGEAVAHRLQTLDLSLRQAANVWCSILHVPGPWCVGNAEVQCKSGELDAFLLGLPRTMHQVQFRGSLGPS